jgi:LytS/YehU family sensor histidine kinase
MQVRMGPRLQTRLDLPEALRDWPVPPLLLQPLVENAIRHGLEPKREGGVLSVCATLDGERLCLTVRDTGLGLVKAVQDGHTGGPSALTGTGTGFGLTQVRERLATTWGEQATFTLVPAAEGGTVATLRLPRLPAGTGS